MSENIGEILKADKELEERFLKILEIHKCTKDYNCLDKKFSELCPVCSLGNTSLLECIGDNNNTCKYLYKVGEKSFCECQVRIFIQKELK